MPQNIASSTAVPASMKPQVLYQVAMPQPTSHLFEVTMIIRDWSASQLDVKLPVWTPGSYLVREYAKHLQEFSAYDLQNNPLHWQKCSKNHWQVSTGSTTGVTLTYRMYAYELTVRTNHLDHSHGYFNPGALLMYLPGWEEQPLELTIVPPQPDWQVTTALPAVAGKQNTFGAIDYDTLVDSPVEIGTHAIYDFEVLGKPHQWAIWGQGNFDIEQIVADTQKLVEAEAKIFGGLPYERYLFLLHLSGNGYGGLEHKASTSLLFPRFDFQDSKHYNRFMGLVAHEFFHLWNVKRLRPKALERFDYDQENYTDALWFCEGVTSFYDLIVPLWAGVYDAKTYLKLVSDSITRLQNVPGRRVQALSESSFDAWIKLYRPDANTKNAQVSYYLKGEVVALLLDLHIRRGSDGLRSLNDVMRRMWDQFGKAEVGYTQAQLREAVEAVAEEDLSQFWDAFIDGTVELPYDDYLNPFGLSLQVEMEDRPTPYLGLELDTECGMAAIVKTVERDSPAQQAGLCPGDELLAIDGFRVTVGQLKERLAQYSPGNDVQMTLFHDDQLATYSVQLGKPQPKGFQIKPVESPTSEQQALYRSWLGAALDDLLP